MEKIKALFRKKRTWAAIIALAAALGAPASITAPLSAIVNAISINQ